MGKQPKIWCAAFCLLLLTSLSTTTGSLLWAKPANAQSNVSSALIQYEAQLVYLTNLIRREHGLAPLRWNRELTLAARDFSRDAVVNQGPGYCGHEDSTGRMPGARLRDAGFTSMSAWGENIVCGLVAPNSAILGWSNSDGHRQQLLDPNFREIGVGYYRDPETGAGFVTQDMSADPSFAPVIIENEALNTATPTVGIYIYQPVPAPGFDGMDAAVEMMLSNEPTFAGGEWQAYAPEVRWSLDAGTGWRTVYVTLRDGLGRTITTADTIYLGIESPSDQLSLNLATRIQSGVDLADLASGEWPLVQLGLNWIADDRDPSFDLQEGAGAIVVDAEALGGTALRVPSGQGEIRASLRTHRFVKDTELGAYVRVKVGDNLGTDELLTVSIDGGGTLYGPLRLHGVDFAAPNQYQEFLLPFVFHSDDHHPFLEIALQASGGTEIFFDAVTFFSRPIGVTAAPHWEVPGGHYRGQGVQARFADGNGRFSTVHALTPLLTQENEPAPATPVVTASATIAPTQPAETPTPDAPPATPTPPAQGTPVLLVTAPLSGYQFDAGGATVLPATLFVPVVCANCATDVWIAQSDATWLHVQPSSAGITLSVDPAGLTPATYSGGIQISAPDDPAVAAVALTVALVVHQPPVSEDDVPTPVPTAEPTPVSTSTPTAQGGDPGGANQGGTGTGFQVYLPITLNR